MSTICGADMVPTSVKEGQMRAKITKRVVDAAQKQSATYLIRDSEVKGFALVVTPAGAKSYAIDYRTGSGRARRSGD